jgi:protoheme IX farnesyltransferase
MSLLYLVAAVALGAGFLVMAWRIRQHPSDGRAAINLFRFSTTYLTLLFLAVALDPLVASLLG